VFSVHRLMSLQQRLLLPMASPSRLVQNLSSPRVGISASCPVTLSSMPFILRWPSSVMQPLPGVFVPKNFRSQEQIVPMGNFCSQDLSFLRPFIPGNWGTKVPGNFGSLEFPGPFIPRNFHSPTILQSISYELQTAVTTVRILCHRPSRERERVYLPQNTKKNIQNHSKYYNSGRLPDR